MKLYISTYSGLGRIFELVLEVPEPLLGFLLPAPFRLHDLFLSHVLQVFTLLLGGGRLGGGVLCR